MPTIATNREGLVGLFWDGDFAEALKAGKNKVSTESAWKANQALRRPLIGELFEKDLAELADDAEPDVS